MRIFKLIDLKAERTKNRVIQTDVSMSGKFRDFIFKHLIIHKINYFAIGHQDRPVIFLPFNKKTSEFQDFKRFFILISVFLAEQAKKNNTNNI